MKQWLCILSICLALMVGGVAGAHAQTWKAANQYVLQWDPVTTMVDGTPLPAGATVRYRIFTKPAPEGQQTEAGIASTTSFTLTFATEGRYFVGVMAERLVDGTIVATSTVSWSNVAEVTGGNPFGIQYYGVPANPKNLR